MVRYFAMVVAVLLEVAVLAGVLLGVVSPLLFGLGLVVVLGLVLALGR